MSRPGSPQRKAGAAPPPDDAQVHQDGHHGGDVDGEQAVAQQAQRLEDADVATLRGTYQK